jgi:hypothetical protein
LDQIANLCASVSANGEATDDVEFVSGNGKAAGQGIVCSAWPIIASQHRNCVSGPGM